MGSISGRKALRVADNLSRILAVELFCAAQAFDFHRPLTSSPALEAVHKELRTHIQVATKDRIYGEDLLKAEQLIKSGKLLELLELHAPASYSAYDDQFEKF